jgi:hypothetical protein
MSQAVPCKGWHFKDTRGTFHIPNPEAVAFQTIKESKSFGEMEPIYGENYLTASYDSKVPL